MNDLMAAAAITETQSPIQQAVNTATSEVMDKAAATAATVATSATAAPAIPPISPSVALNYILDSLILKDYVFSVKDALRYTIAALSVMLILLYMFPYQILILFILCISIALTMIYIAICKKLSYKNKPINSQKLNSLRNNVNNDSRAD